MVLLLALCYVINGPFARWLVYYGLNKALEGQGMAGSADVSGTLSEGFIIRNLSYKGNEGIQSLRVAELSAHYKFTELFSGRVRRVDLSKGAVVIDISKFPKSEEEEKSTESKLRQTLGTLHSWINKPAIVVSDLNISLLKSGEKQAQFVVSEFHHQANSNEFEIIGFTATDRDERSTPTQDVHIIWESESASMDRFEVLPDIAVAKVAIDWSKDFKGEGIVQFFGAYLKVTAAHEITATLSEGNIDSHELNKRFDLEIPAEFSVSAIDLTISDWQQPVPQWDIRADLKLTSVKYEDYSLSDTSIQLTQQDLVYNISINGSLNTNPLTIKSKGKWLAPESEQWWSHTSASYDVSVPKLGSLTTLIEDLPEGLSLEDTSIKASGNLAMKDNTVTQANIEGQVSGLLAKKTPLPPLNLTATYQADGKSQAKVTALRNKAILLQLDADYHVESSDYQGTLKVFEKEPVWINALAEVFKANFKLDGPVALTWSGQGNAKDFTDPKRVQKGQLQVTELHLKLPDTPSLNIATEINYNWPESVDLTSLTVREGDWSGSAALTWNGNTIDVTNINLKQANKELATLRGKIPFREEIDTSQKFLAQTEAWNLTVKTQPIALNKLHEWFKIDALNRLSGTTDLDLELSGSPSKPEVKGSARASDVKGLDDGSLLPLQLAFNFHSENQKLLITGNLLEGKAERFALTGSLPFTPSVWVRDPGFMERFVSNAPLSAEIKVNTLPLGRFKNFVPQLEAITGTINGTAKLSGTIEKPLYRVNLDADVPLLRIKKSEIGDIRNIKLNTRFDQNQKATTKLTAQVNGGKFEAGGTVDLTDFEEPRFDLYLRTQYALVHRDDLVSVRANSDLKLKGNMEDAIISGTIGIAESLCYKDIELIPIGVPSSEVAKVRMPALSKKKADDKLPIPEPFANWKLNITLRTDDPVLIRGNVASGNLSGTVKVGGTLAKPAPLGTILVNKVKAKLPFSILTIERGEIKFDPKNGLDPVLNIRGKSTVGAHDVSVFVYGSASSPKTSFTAYPPLPESEVMTLLATGTTTAGLENRSVATFKAFQIFLLKLQQRNDKPGGNKLFKTLLSGIDDLNLNVGETDQFTGRKFSSATVEVHPHWNFTAQVDDQQQTRGLIVYVIRFR